MQSIEFLGCDEEVTRKEGKTAVTRSTTNVFAPTKSQVSIKQPSENKVNEEGHIIKPLMEMDDNARVHDFLSYNRNELKVVCKF